MKPNGWIWKKLKRKINKLQFWSHVWPWLSQGNLDICSCSNGNFAKLKIQLASKWVNSLKSWKINKLGYCSYIDQAYPKLGHVFLNKMNYKKYSLRRVLLKKRLATLSLHLLLFIIQQSTNLNICKWWGSGMV